MSSYSLHSYCCICWVLRSMFFPRFWRGLSVNLSKPTHKNGSQNFDKNGVSVKQLALVGQVKRITKRLTKVDKNRPYGTDTCTGTVNEHNFSQSYLQTVSHRISDRTTSRQSYRIFLFFPSMTQVTSIGGDKIKNNRKFTSHAQPFVSVIVVAHWFCQGKRTY